MATWADVKAQAAEMLGIQLTDADVVNVPLLRTDPYGNFIPGAERLPAVITRLGPTACRRPPTTSVERRSGRTPVSTADALRTGHAFLDDIAHDASPDGTLEHGDMRRIGRRYRRITGTTPQAPTTTSCSTPTSSPATAAATRTSA